MTASAAAQPAAVAARNPLGPVWSRPATIIAIMISVAFKGCINPKVVTLFTPTISPPQTSRTPPEP